MWKFVKLFGVLALVINSEAVPKQYSRLRYLKPTAADDGRLGEDITPTNYNLDLVVTEDNLKGGIFTGTVKITLHPSQNNLKTFKIHAKNITIDKNAITLTGANTVTVTDPDANDLITITSDVEIPDQADLTIKYSGLLSDTDMDGFYRSSYKDGDNLVYLATTQFEEMGARRAFPSFDEPSFKATFDIAITYSNGYTAISNMDTKSDPADTDDGFKKVTFKQTPPMSTYLVAFIVSKFTCTNGPTADTDIPTSICARTAAADSIAHAEDVAPKALDTMKNFTNIGYSTFKIGKMTQAAIPDFAIGAMENWGLVTYREADLLWKDKESSNYYKQKVTTAITHEFSHQWFGDYVTLDWWSDVFLNEGFATYFEYYASALIEPEWQLEKQFVIDQVQPVLVTDSKKESKALTYSSSTFDEKFEDISYNKGGTILRMLDNVLGHDNFKKGLTTYLNENAGKNVSPDNVWIAFEETITTDDLANLLPKNANLSSVMDNWVNQPGYPLLNVILGKDKKTVNITQKRFLLTNDSIDTKWYVPITYITNKNTDASKTTTQWWLLPDADFSTELDEEVDWIILNNQQVGYYRVIYDAKTLDNIKKALNDKISNIDEISRAQLVDDQFNFARAGIRSYDEVLDFLTFLKNDDSYYSWSSALNGFRYMLQHTHDSTVKNSLNKYILDLMGQLLKSEAVTEDLNTDNQIPTFTQVLAKTWACKLGNQDCVNDALSKFSKYTNDTPAKVEANFRSFVYCTGLSNSKNASGEYDFLYNQYKKTDLSTEKVTILNALGCVKEAEQRQKYLSASLSEDIRVQDAKYVYSSVYSNTPEGVDDVLDFIKNNHANIKEHFGATSTFAGIIGDLSDYITTQDQVTKLEDFANTTGLDAELKAAANDALTKAKTNFETVKNLETVLKKRFNINTSGDTSAGYVNGFYVGNLALILIVYYMFNY